MAALKQAEPNLKKWACLACTYLNEACFTNCDMCTALRPDDDENGNKRSKVTDSSSSSPARSSSHVGPAAFIAALASLTPTNALTSSVPLGYRVPPLVKRNFGAGNNKIRLLSWNTGMISL